MGTRADFYVGRGESAEWLGSYPWDGYPCGVFEDAPELFVAPPVTEPEWRGFVTEFLSAQSERATTPDMGWPWPWPDSRTTDYAYALDGGVIYGSSFGHSWFRLDPEAENWGEVRDDAGKVAVFPDMSARKAVTLGPRSGLIVLGFASGGEVG